LISRSRFFPIVSIPRSRNRSSTSRRIALNPDRANTCAMPFPIVPAPSTATVLILARVKKPPLKTPAATESQDKQERQDAAAFSRFLELLFEGVARASHAASVANFSSCDHGDPTDRPSSVTRRISAFGLIRNIRPARSRSSFFLIRKSSRPQRAIA